MEWFVMSRYWFIWIFVLAFMVTIPLPTYMAAVGVALSSFKTIPVKFAILFCVPQ